MSAIPSESSLSADALDQLAARLERIESSLTRIDRLVGRVSADGPGAVATVMDIADELAADAQARDIDLDQVLRAAVLLLTRLAEVMQTPAFTRLVESGALSPQSAEALAEAGDALVATREEAGGKAGLWALMRAARDPDVQRALDFAIRLMKRIGGAMAEQAEVVTSEEE